MRSTNRRFEVRSQRTRTAIRKKSDRVRLSVFKSGRHLYAQLIDDKNGCTLASASTLDQSMRVQNKSCCNIYFAEKVGQLIGERAKNIGVEKVVFDKSGYKYHGVVKTLADSARQYLVF
ncbi:MAG: 50S ribosomal protein L18 [Alphaproteobacteria bacterium]|nr:50S ribosomal protein L18 [Alphaproteobacteria bacterium]